MHIERYLRKGSCRILLVNRRLALDLADLLIALIQAMFIVRRRHYGGITTAADGAVRSVSIAVAVDDRRLTVGGPVVASGSNNRRNRDKCDPNCANPSLPESGHNRAQTGKSNGDPDRSAHTSIIPGFSATIGRSPLPLLDGDYNLDKARTRDR